MDAQDLTSKYRSDLEHFDYVKCKVKYAERLIHYLASNPSDERVPSKLFYAKSVLEGVINEQLEKDPVKLNSLEYNPISYLYLWQTDGADIQSSRLGFPVICHSEYDINYKRYLSKTASLGIAQYWLQNLRIERWAQNVQDTIETVVVDPKKVIIHLITAKGELHRFNVGLSIFDKTLQLDIKSKSIETLSFDLKVSESGMLLVYNKRDKHFDLLTSEYISIASFPLSSFVEDPSTRVSSFCFDKVGQIFVLTSQPMLVYILNPRGVFLSRILDKDARAAKMSETDSMTKRSDQVAQNPTVIMVSASSKIFILLESSLEIRSIAGDLIESLPLGSKRFMDIVSSPDGLTVVVGEEPLFLGPDGKALSLAIPHGFMNSLTPLPSNQISIMLSTEEIFAAYHDNHAIHGFSHKFEL
eukprot:TRINITY_DN10668_c0_g1_i2.p1 TRINITY_DN10668_c0_g1~~TRINITY_DN10668_c0_g1_i2.p1  ORF type:complete len:414 (+),score=78.27 TRINITY_DN10668_c0_g1_i2:81-1322(+)